MIIIFAGHHSKKPGACFEGFCEHDEALRWLEIIKANTNSEDFIIGPVGTLREKTQFVNQRNPLLAIDLHFNSAPLKDGKPQGEGSMTLYYPGSNKGLNAAIHIQTQLAKIFLPDKGEREGYYRLDPNRGADWFLARTTCTALIPEPAYIHEKKTIVTRREDGCMALIVGANAAVVYLQGGT